MLDYHVLGERTDDDGQLVRRVLLVVAYRELIDRYVAACKKAGLRLAGIDLEAFALLRALGDPLPADAPPSDAALVVVSVGHDRSTFAVSDGRVCEFTRVLDWGGSTLDVAIARELDCAPSEAEPVKRELSLATANVPEGLTQDQADRAREAVRRQLQTFARELVSSLQFYQNQPGSLGIGEIVITGGTAHLGGVADELQRLIGVRVEVGDPLHAREARARSCARPTSSSARSRSPSASGSRTDVRAINLLPRDDARRGRPQKSQWIVLVPVVLAVLLAALLSAMFLSASGTAKDKQAELATLQDELHAIPTPDASRVKTQTALAADKQARVTRALRGALAPGRLGPRLP